VTGRENKGVYLILIEKKKLKNDSGNFSVDIGITVEEWKEMLVNEEIFYDVAKGMIGKWYLFPNQEATHNEVMEKHSEEYLNYKASPFNGIVKGLAKQIMKHLNRFEVTQSDGEGSSYWSILFEGWIAEKSRNGGFVWKLRKELVQAIDELDLFIDHKFEKKATLANELEVHISDFKQLCDESALSVTSLSNMEVVSLVAEFQDKFPKEKLASLTFEEYALGTNSREDSYSYWLEYKTDKLGSIKGGSVDKHGIWFSKDEGFRTSSKFSAESKEASMDIMRKALADLITQGIMRNFDAIEEGILANTVKYKTLYMYYPNLYLPIFSNDHYSYLIKELGYSPKDYKGIGVKQKLLIEIKEEGKKLSKLSMHEYAHFLYYLFGTPRRKKDSSSEIWIDGGTLKGNDDESNVENEGNLKMTYQLLDLDLAAVNDKSNPTASKENAKPFKRDYVAKQKSNMITGEKGEVLVVEYEKDRLKKYQELKSKIEQKSLNDDSLGYDILSFETNGRERYIEVKTTGGKISSELSFYLTDNELQTAKRDENYWIYIVSEIDTGMPKITPLKNLFSEEHEECVQIKPLKYLVSVGVVEVNSEF